MTEQFQFGETFMIVNESVYSVKATKLLAFVVLSFWLFPLASVVHAQTPVQQSELQIGFAASQRCEAEIDDDLDQYRECIGHVINALPAKGAARLGAHFQAWLMADLASRQASPVASSMRKTQHQYVKRFLIEQRLNLRQLVTFKNLRWHDISTRWHQQL